MRLALIVEYEGKNYSGFQYQRNAPSVQHELEQAIERLTGERVRVKGAGRTDAGVHARAQVAAFDTESRHSPCIFVRALNFYLPEDIAVKAAYVVKDDFDPRRHALRRRYRYTILNSCAPSPLTRRTACHIPEPLDSQGMIAAAACFLGEHDFARFAAPPGGGKSTRRRVFESRIRRDGDIITFDVEANAFLPHQVRRMAGALVDIGRGRLSRDELVNMIEGRPTEAVAHSLPPQGLCLMEVRYADFPPEVGEQNDDKR